MTEFSKRLKEERERLGFTQAKFGEACGVGRTAQFNYERGEREPGWSYMEAAEKLGVDALYVISGVKKGDDWAYARAYRRMLVTVEMMLGLEEGQIDKIAREYMNSEADYDAAMQATGGSGGATSAEKYNLAVLEWLQTSKRPDCILDLDLLSTILAAIADVAPEHAGALDAAKRAKAAAVLYRASQASGKVDKALVRETVDLAAQK